MNRQADRKRWAKYIGRLVITLVWCAGLYLVIYYALVWGFGPSRLHSFFGASIYNAIFPIGGVSLFLFLAGLVLLWGGPFAVFYLLARCFFRLTVSRWISISRVGVAALIALILTAALPFVLLDGWPGALFPLLLGEDTEFAPGYTAGGFLAVRSGMDAEQVLGLLGEPLSRRPASGRDGGEVWFWTRSPGSHNYRARHLTFQDGRVTGKFSEFYVD